MCVAQEAYLSQLQKENKLRNKNDCVNFLIYLKGAADCGRAVAAWE